MGVTPKNGPKVKKRGYKSKKNDTKLGITQVLIKLQQKNFHQSELGASENVVLT